MDLRLRFTQARWHFVRSLQLHCLSRFNLCMCMSAHLATYLSLCNLHGRQQMAPFFRRLGSVIMYVIHINIPEYTEYFRVYTELREQVCNKCGSMIIHTQLFPAHTWAVVMINVELAQAWPNFETRFNY